MNNLSCILGGGRNVVTVPWRAGDIYFATEHHSEACCYCSGRDVSLHDQANIKQTSSNH